MRCLSKILIIAITFGICGNVFAAGNNEKYSVNDFRQVIRDNCKNVEAKNYPKYEKGCSARLLTADTATVSRRAIYDKIEVINARQIQSGITTCQETQKILSDERYTADLAFFIHSARSTTTKWRSLNRNKTAIMIYANATALGGAALTPYSDLGAHEEQTILTADLAFEKMMDKYEEYGIRWIDDGVWQQRNEHQKIAPETTRPLYENDMSKFTENKNYVNPALVYGIKNAPLRYQVVQVVKEKRDNDHPEENNEIWLKIKRDNVHQLFCAFPNLTITKHRNKGIYEQCKNIDETGWKVIRHEMGLDEGDGSSFNYENMEKQIKEELSTKEKRELNTATRKAVIRVLFATKNELNTKLPSFPIAKDRYMEWIISRFAESFRVTQAMGCQNLITGAIGTGVFNNDMSDVAQALKTAIDRYKPNLTIILCGDKDRRLLNAVKASEIWSSKDEIAKDFRTHMEQRYNGKAEGFQPFSIKESDSQPAMQDLSAGKKGNNPTTMAEKTYKDLDPRTKNLISCIENRQRITFTGQNFTDDNRRHTMKFYFLAFDYLLDKVKKQLNKIEIRLNKIQLRLDALSKRIADFGKKLKRI